MGAAVLVTPLVTLPGDAPGDAGDNYDYPPEVEQCLLNLGGLTPENVPQQVACENLVGGGANYRNSVVAIDINTGAIKWVLRVCFGGEVLSWFRAAEFSCISPAAG